MSYLDDIAGQIRRAVKKDVLPKEDVTGLFRLYAMLLLAKGETVTAEDVHNAWVAWMESLGRVHESMVPFAELAAETQAEDVPFVDAIRSVARSMRVSRQIDR